MAYSADTLKQTAVLNLVPNVSDGGIWMAGTAPAADATGNIYLILGNGTFDTSLDASEFPLQGDCGNCYAKISSTSPLRLLDYFTPLNTVVASAADVDFGSGGPLLLPDLTDATGTTRHLAVGSGKDANIYILDRDNMGKFNANQDNVYELISGQLAGGEFAKPSYFNSTVYYGAVGDALKAFPITNARLAVAPSSQSSNLFPYPGTTPSSSANVAASGIVWAVENGSTAALHAYDATNLATEVYNPTKQLTAATNSLETNSSRLWSRMEESILARPTAWPCSACCRSDIKLRPEVAGCPFNAKLKINRTLILRITHMRLRWRDSWHFAQARSNSLSCHAQGNFATGCGEPVGFPTRRNFGSTSHL